jgi:hypothetical protein
LCVLCLPLFAKRAGGQRFAAAVVLALLWFAAAVVLWFATAVIL